MNSVKPGQIWRGQRCLEYILVLKVKDLDAPYHKQAKCISLTENEICYLAVFDDLAGFANGIFSFDLISDIDQ